MNQPDPDKVPLVGDLAAMWYLITVIGFGSLSALAALLQGSTVVTVRTVITYLLAGGLASAGLVMLFVENYGFSWFLLGLSVFAGYKAVDVLTLASGLVQIIIKKLTSPNE